MEMARKDLITLCKLSQKALIKGLPKTLNKHGYKNVISTKDYIFAKGSVPVCLVCHLDTVHKEQVKSVWCNIENEFVITSPEGIGGDDRCGVYMALYISRIVKCSLLFTTDEEVGCLGAEKFIEDYKTIPNVNFFLELDRRGKNDVVRYDDGNRNLINKFIEYGFDESEGSYTDISVLCPHFEISGVNVSCGYYKAHTTQEYINIIEMVENCKILIKLLQNENVTKNKYLYEEIEEYPYTRWYKDNYNGFLNGHANVCMYCGKQIEPNEAVYIEYETFCKECAELMQIEVCDECGCISETIKTKDGRKLCEYCYDYEMRNKSEDSDIN